MLLFVGVISPLFGYETKFLMILARHGAHDNHLNPLGSSKKDQLTGNGLRMGYQLGRYLREMYDDFLPEKMNSRRTYVVSSGVDRTKQFAQAMMLGIFDFGSLPVQENVEERYKVPEWIDFNVESPYLTPLPRGFQPVTIHSFAEEEDFVFSPDDPKVCPQSSSYFTLSHPKGDILNEILPSLLDEIKREWEYDTLFPEIDSFQQVGKLYRYLVSRKYLGTSYISDGLMTKLHFYASMAFFVKYSNPDLIEFATYELNNLLLSFLEAADAGLDSQDENYKNLVVLVGHSSNLMLLFIQLRLTTFECLMEQYRGSETVFCPGLPGYASSAFFDVEIHEGKTSLNFIVDGMKRRYCGIEDDYEVCSLKDSIKRLKSLTSSESRESLRKRFCFAPEEDRTWQVLAMLAFNSIVLVLIVNLLMMIKRKRARS